MSLVSDERVEELLAAERKMMLALKFIRDLATEEYAHVQVGTGAEVVLRHIIRRCNEVLGD